jgi:hypothetical protein
VVNLAHLPSGQGYVFGGAKIILGFQFHPVPATLLTIAVGMAVPGQGVYVGGAGCAASVQVIGA